MFGCILCEKETCIICNLCPKCLAIKNLIAVYGDRVGEVLENVLLRKEDALKSKERVEIGTEKKKIDNSLKALEKRTV